MYAMSSQYKGLKCLPDIASKTNKNFTLHSEAIHQQYQKGKKKSITYNAKDSVSFRFIYWFPYTGKKKMQGCIPPTYTLFLLLLILFEKNYYTSGQIIKVCWSVQMFSETFLQNSKQWGS